MPSFTNSYTEPGSYVVINDDVATQTNTGLLSVCIIGTGTQVKPVNNLELFLIPPTSCTTAFKSFSVGTTYHVNQVASIVFSGTTNYYNCIKENVCTQVPETATSAYLSSNWEAITPDATNWSAQLDSTYPVQASDLPTKVTGSITTKVYNNTETVEGSSVTNFTISNNTLLWNNSRISALSSEQASESGRYGISISYNSVKASDDYKIKGFTRLSSIFSTYGNPSAENSISLAAQIAADNGATVFYCVQPNPTVAGNVSNGALTEAGLTVGLTEAKRVDTYCILPMIEFDPTTTGKNLVASKCKAHVESMSSTLERKERVCILSGLQTTETSEIDTAVAKYKSAASSIGSARVIYIAPSSVDVLTENGSVKASGMYAAAALAGILCNNNFTCGEPISGKTLADISINDRYTREEKNQMAAYGCLVLEGAEGTTVPKIRHALSTVTGDYIKSEIKITKIKDTVASTLRLALDKAYINTRFVGAQTISEMSSTVNTILSSFMANNDIISYSNLVIAQDTNYPNQVNVSFRIKPAVDINYILITFGVSFNG